MEVNRSITSAEAFERRRQETRTSTAPTYEGEKGIALGRALGEQRRAAETRLPVEAVSIANDGDRKNL